MLLCLGLMRQRVSALGHESGPKVSFCGELVVCEATQDEIIDRVQAATRVGGLVMKLKLTSFS